MGGFGTMMPGIATAFTIGGLSSLGLPATAGFVAEFLTFMGAYASAHPWWLFPGVFGAFVTAVYVLRVTKAIFWGDKSEDPHFHHLPDAQGTEWAALGILAFTLVLFGVMPSLAIKYIDTSTVPLLNRLPHAEASAVPVVSVTSTKFRFSIVPYHAMMARTLAFTWALVSVTVSVP